MLCGVVVDEREDLALALGELRRGCFGNRTHVRTLDGGADGVKVAGRGVSASMAPVHALVAELVDALG